MAASPGLKIYDAENEYRASFHYAEDAASFIAFLGDGATIRNGHARKFILWSEGNEEQPAAESFDFVAETVNRRASRGVVEEVSGA